MAANETDLINITTSLIHAGVEIQAMYELCIKLSKSLMLLILRMQRAAAEATPALKGGENHFDVEAARQMYATTDSVPAKIMMIASNLFVSWPYVIESTLALQSKVSTTLALATQVRHAYSKFHVLSKGRDKSVLHQEINIILAKLGTLLQDSTQQNSSLVQDLQDGFEILSILQSFNIENMLTDFSETYKQLSLRAIANYNIIRSLPIPKLELIL